MELKPILSREQIVDLDAPKIFFTDFFQIPKILLDKYGAFNISLVADLPLFIDPFLLFNSKEKEYKDLHEEIISYLRFLKKKSTDSIVDSGLLMSLYHFGEVEQTWLGYSLSGNDGRGLGRKFANALNTNFGRIFSNYGDETATGGTHLEKLCLINEGVGKDSISDFTTNLIKGYLLSYTEAFARQYLNKSLCSNFQVEKVSFNYETESWRGKIFYLPSYQNNFVLLTPKDILTKDDTWINRQDLLSDFWLVANALPNKSLRSQVNNYFLKVLSSEKPTTKEIRDAMIKVAGQFPELIDYFIRRKEETGDRAVSESVEEVLYSEDFFVNGSKNLAEILSRTTEFYSLFPTTRDEAIARIEYLKTVIEKNDGYKYFYKNGNPIRDEEDLKISFQLVWFGTPSDVSMEVNSGRGPADSKISRGALDKTMIEFKLAKNSNLKKNISKQQEIHKDANEAPWGIKVILFFTKDEENRAISILRELGMENDRDIVLIDARSDNKPSASKA